MDDPDYLDECAFVRDFLYHVNHNDCQDVIEMVDNLDYDDVIDKYGLLHFLMGHPTFCPDATSVIMMILVERHKFFLKKKNHDKTPLHLLLTSGKKDVDKQYILRSFLVIDKRCVKYKAHGVTSYEFYCQLGLSWDRTDMLKRASRSKVLCLESVSELQFGKQAEEHEDFVRLCKCCYEI